MTLQPTLSVPGYSPADRLLRLGQVIEIVGLGKTMIYRKVRSRTFPQPYKPGGVATRWSEKEVFAWLAALGSERIQ
ncbi:MAG: AlpA family phage regulatory protein [Sphingomicrobium sp.]